MSVLTLAETFGRRFVMDLGFGAFLEKFEEYAGKGATKCLVILIGSSVALVCANLIWTMAIRPVVGGILQAYQAGGFWALAFGIFGLALAVALGFGACLFTYGTLATWRLKRVYDKGIARMEALLAEADRRANDPSSLVAPSNEPLPPS